MPIYEYECRRCGHRFELIQKFSDKPRKRCPECSGSVDRLISPPAIRFKGTGWYVTDYADKKISKEAKEAKEAKADAGSGGKKSESKVAEAGSGDKKSESKKAKSKKEKKAS